MAAKLPHPIPYQGSKRSLAPVIGRYLPRNMRRFYEPFAGSAAMSIYAAHHKLAERFVISDSLGPMVDLLRLIVNEPNKTAAKYRAVWQGQQTSDLTYFNTVRARYNSDREPDATAADFVYMDPPYLGTSVGRDKRYHEQLGSDQIIEGLAALRSRNIRFALSYDGMTGDKEYGPPLPDSLGLTRLLLHAGISSQATLSGRKQETIESLYVTPGLAEARQGIIRRDDDQKSFARKWRAMT